MNKRDRHEHEHNGERKREESGHEPGERRHGREPHGTGYGTERRVYEEYLSRKWEGSEPPSPQAYAQAIRLWRQLPGSIMTAPADLASIPESKSGGEQNEPPRKDDANEQESGS
jgi:hypothetical protein